MLLVRVVALLSRTVAPRILTISAHTGGQSLRGAYSENLPIGPLNLGGPITGGEGIVAVQLNNPNATPQLVFWLFMPTAPGSVLGGFITGATMITNQPQLSTSRLLMFRLLPGSASEAKSYSYLEPGASVAADLSTLGLVVDSPELVDRAIGAYLDGGRSGGLDQVTAADYLDLVDLINRQLLVLDNERSLLARSATAPP